ncbi:MAG: hypothetical protein IJT23_03845 [Clostridia bacterium]|nr:hypothetical protein [Clostridia bacterium]
MKETYLKPAIEVIISDSILTVSGLLSDVFADGENSVGGTQGDIGDWTANDTDIQVTNVE